MGDKLVFWGLIGVLLWTPIPLGSDRLWSSLLLSCCIFSLAGYWLLLFCKGRVAISTAFLSAKPCWLALICVVGWNALQIIPMPFSWIKTLSPHAAEIYASVSGDFPLFVPISLDTGASLVSLMKAAAYLVFFCLMLLAVNDRRRLRILLYCAVAGGIFQAVYGSIMAMGGPVGSVATGTFVNRNHLAGHLELCLALGIGLLMSEPSALKSNRWRAKLKLFMQLMLGPKARLRLGLAIMVIALVLTRSRMGNSAFFASLLIAGGVGLALFKTAKTSTLFLLASLVLIDMFIVGHWFGVEEVATRIQETNLSTEDRDDVDISTLPLYKDYWLTGSGAGSYYNIFTAYKPNYILEYWDHAHNDYMEFACELGLIGFIPLSLSVIFSLFAAIKAQLNRSTSMSRGMGFGSTMGIIALLIHSSVDFNLQIPSNALLFITVISIAWIARDISERPLLYTLEQ